MFTLIFLTCRRTVKALLRGNFTCNLARGNGVVRHVSEEGMLHGATLKLLQSLHEKSCRVTCPLIDKRLADTRVSERHLTERSINI